MNVCSFVENPLKLSIYELTGSLLTRAMQLLAIFPSSAGLELSPSSLASQWLIVYSLIHLREKTIPKLVNTFFNWEPGSQTLV